MKLGRYILSIFCFLLFTCGKDKGTTKTITAENSNQKTAITEKAIDGFDYTDYALSTESEKTVANWQKYNELAIQINYLKKADLSFFNEDKDSLKKFLVAFKTVTPKVLKTNPIISRTVILETMLLKLNENLTLENIDTRDKLLSIKEVLVAFSNLNFQINKKLESDFYDKIQPEY